MNDDQNKIPRVLNILVVDDDEKFRDVVSSRLSKAAFRVTTAKDGDAALVALEAGKFDLVVLDIVMPGMSGFEVLRAIREKNIETKIIMLSVLRQEEDLRLAKELGASECFPKLAPAFVDDVVKYAERMSTQ